MNAVRRGAAVAQRYLVSLYVLGVVVQFFLVGWGLFGMNKGDTVQDAKSLDPHRGFGWIFTQLGGLLLLLATLIAWQRPRGRRVGLYVLLCLLGFPVQPLLAGGGEHHQWVGMLHPVNAMLLLGLSGYLAHRAWTTDRGAERAPEAAPAAAAR
ncbi:MAG: hypothetical protein V7644_2425 [Actinomycetota bacterium]